jgi:putative acetyltransferase
VIRSERADDPREVGAIGDVVAAAFGSPVEAELVAAIRASEHYIPQASLVATQAGRIAGHVMVSYVMLDDGRSRRRICSLSPLAVAPAYQGLGVGSALVRAVVDVVDRMGEPLIVLEGSPAYYGRLGFEHSVPHGIHIHLPDWAPAEAAQLSRLRNYDPSIRGEVVYPPAFEAATAAAASH